MTEWTTSVNSLFNEELARVEKRMAALESEMQALMAVKQSLLWVQWVDSGRQSVPGPMSPYDCYSRANPN